MITDQVKRWSVPVGEEIRSQIIVRLFGQLSGKGMAFPPLERVRHFGDSTDVTCPR